MVTIKSNELGSLTNWDQMTDWCLKQFGTPEADFGRDNQAAAKVRAGARWGYTASSLSFKLYFNSEEDAILYLLRWGGETV